MKKFLLIAALYAISATSALAQVALNPCNGSAVRSSATITMSSATTTQLVPLASGQTIYVCDATLTISQVVTTANTIKFVYGTGANCVTGTTDLTGAFGTGGITAGIPITVNTGGFKTIASNALCATTTIGATGFFHGVVSYIQQ